MTNVTKIVAALLVLLAVLLGVYAMVLASSPEPEVPVAAVQSVAATQTYPVVVADKLLPAGHIIDPASVKIVQLSINPTGAFTSPGDLKDKIPRFDIGVGVPVTADAMVKGLALQLKEGERAVAVSVDEVIGSGNRVHPGDYVDVFFTLKQGQDINRTQARLLLSRLRVLTYGENSVDGGPAAADPTLRNGQPVVPRTAVLAVPTPDVNQLLLATQNGRLQLALRHPTDENVPDLALFPEQPTVLAGKPGLNAAEREQLKAPGNRAFAGSELNALAGESRPAAAPRPTVARAAPTTVRVAPRPAPRAEPNTVEVVRGTKRETVGF